MVSTKRVSSVSIYFALWCMYSLQGVIYTSGGIISKGLLLIILVWSISVMYMVNTKVSKLPNFFKAVNIFLLVTSLYGVMLIVSGKDLYVSQDFLHTKISNFDYLKNIYMSLLPMYVFYYYALKGEMKIHHILVFIVVLLFINVANYFNDRSIAMMRAIQNRTRIDGFTLNVGYKFVGLLPLILVYQKRPLIQYILTLTTLFFIILCMKRGAILIGVICFIVFMFTMIKFSKRSHKYIVVLMSLVSLAIGVYFITNLITSNDYFLYRIEQTLGGDSSSRDELYSIYVNHFISEQNFFRFLLGNGANATLEVGVNYAHNDWLELAINNGIVGLVLYLWYYVALFRDYIYIKKFNHYYANVVIMVLIILLMSSVFSMSYDSIDRSVAIALGFVFAKSYPNQHENNLFYR